MRNLILAAALIAGLAGPVGAAQQRGQETKIVFASNGGLREWEAGPPNSGIVYVRDRTEHWYQVTLTGPCVKDRTLDRLSYTTDPLGTFDRFARVSLGHYPNQVCGVSSIKTSAPPPGHLSARKPR